MQYTSADERPRQFLNMTEDEMAMVVSQVMDENLKHTLQFGIGLHHAGLNDRDRSLVEELFTNTKIQVFFLQMLLSWLNLLLPLAPMWYCRDHVEQTMCSACYDQTLSICYYGPCSCSKNGLLFLDFMKSCLIVVCLVAFFLSNHTLEDNQNAQIVICICGLYFISVIRCFYDHWLLLAHHLFLWWCRY